jgi:N-acetyl-gamma-glutamyl-phosphate reductase
MDEFDPDAIADKADAALVAYPHKAAALAVKALRERGLKVVDLSADFRLGQALYERWYQPHEAPELLAESVYGMPELHREEIARADLVAGPGCNSTAALLALLPLAGRIDEAAVDIKAGVSGAGREATDETHFVSVVDNVNAYKVEGHRHTAELEQELPGVHFSFVAHLLPIDQGILASCYARPSQPITHAEAQELYREAYRDEPFVEVLDYPPRTRDVRDTNRATVQVAVVNERVLAFCAIDNLWKGAAGQAVQDLNLMLGLPETEGLL